MYAKSIINQDDDRLADYAYLSSPEREQAILVLVLAHYDGWATCCSLDKEGMVQDMFFVEAAHIVYRVEEER